MEMKGIFVILLSKLNRSVSPVELHDPVFFPGSIREHQTCLHAVECAHIRSGSGNNRDLDAHPRL